MRQPTAYTAHIIWTYPSMDTPLRSRVVWTEAEPFQVTIYFFTTHDDKPLEWMFARDILQDAIEHGSAGMGDVSAQRGAMHLRLTLRSPFGTATFWTNYREIDKFLAKTYTTSPRDREVMHLPDYVDPSWADLL